MFAAAAMMAPDGRCKTLDATADGYVRGEACVAIVLRCVLCPNGVAVSLPAPDSQTRTQSHMNSGGRALFDALDCDEVTAVFRL